MFPSDMVTRCVLVTPFFAEVVLVIFAVFRKCSWSASFSLGESSARRLSGAVQSAAAAKKYTSNFIFVSPLCPNPDNGNPLIGFIQPRSPVAPPLQQFGR